jgi:hypothetical protein
MLLLAQLLRYQQIILMVKMVKYCFQMGLVFIGIVQALLVLVPQEQRVHKALLVLKEQRVQQALQAQ